MGPLGELSRHLAGQEPPVPRQMADAERQGRGGTVGGSHGHRCRWADTPPRAQCGGCLYGVVCGCDPVTPSCQ